MYWAGLAAASLGRHGKAVEYFARAEQRGLQSADLQFNIAQSHHLHGEQAAARSALDRAMQLNPQHPEAIRLSNLILKGNPQPALQR
jgi:tetratricopeptide (TPR) repeat protein